jgi:hypothetical protein
MYNTMSSKWKTVASMAMVLGYAGSSNAQSVDSPASIAVASTSELLRSEKSLSTQANQLNQNQWIRISDDGLIRGSISLLVGSQNVRQGKVPIALIQDGATVHETLTDVEGDFMIEKAKPGVYSLVALGENQLAICSLTVLSKKDGPHLPDRVHIRSLGPVSPRVSELLRSNTMPTWTVGSQQSSDPIAPIRTFARSCEIRIDARGGISGTLARANATVDLGSTAVYLVRDGQEVARTRASSSVSSRFRMMSLPRRAMVTRFTSDARILPRSLLQPQRPITSTSNWPNRIAMSPRRSSPSKSSSSVKLAPVAQPWAVAVAIASAAVAEVAVAVAWVATEVWELGLPWVHWQP